METSPVRGFRRSNLLSSPFGGIPRNWKLYPALQVFSLGTVPPSGGSLEIGNLGVNLELCRLRLVVPPSGGSLEIGNLRLKAAWLPQLDGGSPFGGIPRNWKLAESRTVLRCFLDVFVPPSGGSLEIGNENPPLCHDPGSIKFPLRGDP